MTVGLAPTVDQINSNLASDAIELRDWAVRALRHWQEVNKLGLAGLMAAPLSMAQVDAQAVLDRSNYMATIAQVYRGTATQGTMFNFDDALCSTWGTG